MLMEYANTIRSDQFAHPIGLKKVFAVRKHYKQRLRKYTTHSEPLIELSNQRKYKEHVFFILISN